MLVVGAGIMGAGIAQVAAQAGHPVLLFDARDGAAAAGQGASWRPRSTAWSPRAGSTPEAAQADAGAHRAASPRWRDAAGAALVVEAIVENLDAKRTLFRQLEGDRRRRLRAGHQHLVDLGHGHRQRPAAARAAGRHALLQPGAADEAGRGGLGPADRRRPWPRRSSSWPAPGARCRCMRARRRASSSTASRGPYYAEALALLLEQAATPPVLDACLRGAGFRMGPCELMDLIGHDTNFAVTNSVYEANFYDKRYRALAGAARDGRRRPARAARAGAASTATPRALPALPVAVHDAPATAREVTVHGDGADRRLRWSRPPRRRWPRRAGARRASAAAAGRAWRSTARAWC